jgi:hypothetical protein
VRVRLHREVNVESPVIVTAEGGAAEAPAPAPEATAATGADATTDASTEAATGDTGDGGDE